jgi:hypothetical protein
MTRLATTTGRDSSTEREFFMGTTGGPGLGVGVGPAMSGVGSTYGAFRADFTDYYPIAEVAPGREVA